MKNFTLLALGIILFIGVLSIFYFSSQDVIISIGAAAGVTSVYSIFWLAHEQNKTNKLYEIVSKRHSQLLTNSSDSEKRVMDVGKRKELIEVLELISGCRLKIVFTVENLDIALAQKVLESLELAYLTVFGAGIPSIYERFNEEIKPLIEEKSSKVDSRENPTIENGDSQDVVEKKEETPEIPNVPENEELFDLEKEKREIYVQIVRDYLKTSFSDNLKIYSMLFQKGQLELSIGPNRKTDFDQEQIIFDSYTALLTFAHFFPRGSQFKAKPIDLKKVEDRISKKKKTIEVEKEYYLNVNSEINTIEKYLNGNLLKNYYSALDETNKLNRLINARPDIKSIVYYYCDNWVSVSTKDRLTGFDITGHQINES